MLSVLRLNRVTNVTLLHITLDDARVAVHGWTRNTPADNWISPPKHHRKEGWIKMYIGESYRERTWTVKAGACGIQIVPECHFMHRARRTSEIRKRCPPLTACLAVCQNFHGRSQVRAKKTGACWQWDQQIRPKWRWDRYTVQPASPPSVVFSAFELLSHQSNFCTAACTPSLMSSLAAFHASKEGWDRGLRQTCDDPYGTKDR